MGRFSNYEDAIKYLYGLQKYGIKFGLSKTENLMAGVGNPHEGKAYIHIAGTNGKGSIAAFLNAVLGEAGYKVGLYTSPHLVRFTERFKINGREISREQVVDLVNVLRDKIVEEEPPTFFEFTTAMALVYFAHENTDISIMEVGMGGRLDATNIIWPLITVISNIAMEHQFFLGNRLLDIAGEKAGIIKPGVPLITGVTKRKVVELFRETCKRKAVPMIRIGEQVRYRYHCRRLAYSGARWRLRDLELGLKGRFQATNAAIALAALEELDRLGFPVDRKAVINGLKNAFWPGRMHILQSNPTVLVDGAHNPRAMQTLTKTVKEEIDHERLIVVIGVMEDKDIRNILKQIVPYADHVIYTRPRYSRAANPEVLFEYGKTLHRSGSTIGKLEEAIDKAKAMARPIDLVVICGSLFTVGEALSYLDPVNFAPEEV